MGISAILHLPHNDENLKQAIVSSFGQGSVFNQELPANDDAAVAAMLDWLSNTEGDR